jgi:hypothetical protein
MSAALPNLAAQSIVVIGGSSGLGLATAHLAFGLGADLTLIARNSARLRQVAAPMGNGDCRRSGRHRSLRRDFEPVGEIDHLLSTADAPELRTLADIDEHFWVVYSWSESWFRWWRSGKPSTIFRRVVQWPSLPDTQHGGRRHR